MGRYLRKITALFPKSVAKYVINRHVAGRLRALLFLVLVICAGVLLQLLVYLDQKVADTKREFDANMREFHYWNTVAAQFPNVPDILYNASISSLNIGNGPQALYFLEKAVRLDPLFEKAQELKKRVVIGKER